jgi:hypothetical protein
MNRKTKGTRNEHRTMRLLEAAGYACTRAAAYMLRGRLVAGVEARIDTAVLRQVQTVEERERKQIGALLSQGRP